MSWDLTWAGEKHQAKITCNHPFQGPERFSAFLGPHPLNARRAISSDKPYLQSADRLFGASPFERIVQYEGAVLVVYRIPEDDEAPSQWFTRSEKAVFWLDATRRGEGLNLMDFCSREYGMAFGTEMGMYGTFEGRVKLGMLTVQTAVSVFEERWR